MAQWIKFVITILAILGLTDWDGYHSKKKQAKAFTTYQHYFVKKGGGGATCHFELNWVMYGSK